MGGDTSDEEDCPEEVSAIATFCGPHEFKYGLLSLHIVFPSPTIRSCFRCSDGLCILDAWTCDGEPDCYVTDAAGVAEDEAASKCGGQVVELSCPQYQCGTGQCILHGLVLSTFLEHYRYLILPSWVCDGEADCDDGSDEGEAVCGQERNGTEACEISRGQWPCEDGSRCLLAGHVCDGVTQCEDESDEAEW